MAFNWGNFGRGLLNTAGGFLGKLIPSLSAGKRPDWGSLAGDAIQSGLGAAGQGFDAGSMGQKITQMGQQAMGKAQPMIQQALSGGGAPKGGWGQMLMGPQGLLGGFGSMMGGPQQMPPALAQKTLADQVPFMKLGQTTGRDRTSGPGGPGGPSVPPENAGPSMPLDGADPRRPAAVRVF